jgi:hypothetical protein
MIELHVLLIIAIQIAELPLTIQAIQPQVVMPAAIVAVLRVLEAAQVQDVPLEINVLIGLLVRSFYISNFLYPTHTPNIEL